MYYCAVDIITVDCYSLSSNMRENMCLISQ